MQYFGPGAHSASDRLRLQTRRRALVRDFFAVEVAEALERALAAVDWSLSYRNAQGDALLTGNELRAMDGPARLRLSEGIHQHAAQDFQFAFLSHSLVHAAQEGRTDLLTRFVRWMAHEEFLGKMRDFTGLLGLNRLYAQATMYAPGNFLMVHDDEVVREKRRVAYVLNLTRHWRADWGGLLQFCNPQGEVIETFFPHFNSLSLFYVPQDHFVSFVTPFAQSQRYAITGWLIEA